MSSEQLPRFRPGNAVPGYATDVIVAGTFVKITADKTAQGDYSLVTCSAGDANPFGVAEQGADAGVVAQSAYSVERRINVSRRGTIARVLAGGTIAAGVPVKIGANGKAIAQGGSGNIVGVACNAAVNNGYVEVDLI